ncbi:fungal-specific transcription factor domain-containing protein [Neurospora tetraspora]|uniref:Fungal-specific transcription factor domain-containing protein n=1 Tax=Neurospora tetraspora TaxID=94610 RepID=A0AAE0MK87_9PEZI|nr:fungal-specific transcription factor domain-containing protein [Neurospora tetraspora]
MTPTPPSTTSSGGRSPEEQFRVVRKRNRVPLSCYPCRSRKLKCDRNHPCGNCTKRGGTDASSCFYATPPARKKSQGQAGASPDDMQNRIDRLEGLVLSLVHGGANIDLPPAATATNAAATAGGGQGAGSTTTSGSSVFLHVDDDDGAMQDDEGESDVDDGLATSLGVLKVDADRGKSMYLGQGHWHTVLADIAEVKNFFALHKKDLEKSYEKVMLSKPPTACEGLTFLFGSTPATEVELRAELPPKSVVLTLCGRYFNSMDNAVNIIHPPTFHQQLRNHWLDPSRTPIMWLGLLYSVMCLAMLSYHKVGDEPPEWKGRTFEKAAKFRLRTVQCLRVGDYTKPTEYTVETMILYLFAEHSSRWDADVGLWLIMSQVTRVAFRMGYHRDAKWFPSLTPFQAEMRRRTWALIRMCDIFFSHQLSLPAMIYEHDCDTDLPHNLADEDFDPDTKVLPPPKPDTEPTNISYMIAKVKLALELGNILQATGRVRNPVHYDEVLRFDAKLREIKANLPPHLRFQPLSGSHDPLTLIIARFNIDILFQKIICLLHRRYMSKATQNIRYNSSRLRAISASLESLGHLATLHRESQPGGRFRSIKWFVTSIATKDFLLPAMLIVLDLHYDNTLRRTKTAPASPPWTSEQRAEMIKSLEVTRDIWKGLADESMDALKAFKVLDIMLDKINGTQSSEYPASATEIPTTTKATEFSDPVQEMRPEHSAAITLGMLSSGIDASSTSPTHAAQSLDGPNYPSLNMNVSADPATSGTGSLSMGLTPDYLGDTMAGIGDTSPFSSLFGDGMGNSTLDFTTNFDWNSFENYTQTAHWGNDQPFQFFSGNGPEQSYFHNSEERQGHGNG